MEGYNALTAHLNSKTGTRWCAGFLMKQMSAQMLLDGTLSLSCRAEWQKEDGRLSVYEQKHGMKTLIGVKSINSSVADHRVCFCLQKIYRKEGKQI